MDGTNFTADQLNATAEMPLNSLEEVNHNPIVRLLIQLRFWWYVTVIPFGLLGNLMSLLVVCRRQNRALSCSVYMGALAIADSAVLLCQAALLLVNSLTGVLTHVTLNILCKICSYASFSAAFGGVLIILALLLDRVIAVTRPLKAALLLSPARAVVITVIIVIIASIYNVPVISSTAFTVQCGSVPGTGLFNTVYQISKLFFSGVLPLLGILIMNIIILRVVKSSRKKKKLSFPQARISYISSGSSAMTNTTLSDGMVNIDISDEVRENPLPDQTAAREGRSANLRMKQTNRQRKRENQLTFMTVLMSFMFLCLTIPKYAHQLAFMNINWRGSVDMLVQFAWSASITSQLFLLNSAINFYLYVMAGTKFRSDLVNMLRCRPSNG